MAVTSCYYFPLMSPAPDSGCRQIYSTLLKSSGENVYKKSASYVSVAFSEVTGTPSHDVDWHPRDIGKEQNTYATRFQHASQNVALNTGSEN
jgi:hypothetical protein